MLSRLLRSYLGRYRGALLAVVVLQALQAAAGLYLPSLNARIIDNGVARNDTGYIWSTGIWMIVITVAQVVCACGNKFTTRSTRQEIRTEICSACHPFFTGKEKLIDAAGRIEKFQRKYGAAKPK